MVVKMRMSDKTEDQSDGNANAIKRFLFSISQMEHSSINPGGGNIRPA